MMQERSNGRRILVISPRNLFVNLRPNTRRAQGSNELSEDAKHQIDLLLKSKFRPEFLNRLDEIVYYKSLTKDEMRKIVDLQLQDLRNRMEEGKHLKLEVTTAAKDFIIDSAYDSVYGARPIKRFIQSRVEVPAYHPEPEGRRNQERWAPDQWSGPGSHSGPRPGFWDHR